MKKALIALVIVLIIAVLILWARSCEPRTKDEADSTTENTLELSDAEIESAFIRANTDFTCQIKNDPSLTEDEDQLKELLNQAYQRYGLPVQDDAKMIDILDKYQNEETVINQIKENVESC